MHGNLAYQVYQQSPPVSLCVPHHERVISALKGSPAMLTIFGQGSRYCDGISRRSFLKIGALGVGAGGFMLSDLYRAEARAGLGSAHKSVINIFLGGGPPHQDLWEIKTEAPAEIRGEFKQIPTRVTGL